jgi:hypothetical protein
MRNPLILPCLLASCLLLVGACSSDDSSDALLAAGGTTGTSGAGGTEDTPPAEGRCVPGKQEECACFGGTGLQRCAEDGSGFGECLCPGEGKGGSGAGGSGTGGSGAGGSGTGGSGAGGGSGGLGGTSGGGPGDQDGDHWTVAQGDCDDTKSGVNPGAFEIAGNGLDDDCDGKVDNAQPACDQGLGPSIASPTDGARALGLCGPLAPATPAANGSGTPSGLIAASFADIAGGFLTTPPKSGANVALQLGIVPDFGSGTPAQEGARVLALSSGVARATGQMDAVKNMCANSKSFSGSTTYPSGFPKEGSCGKGGTPNDGIALDLQLRAPSNARSFRIRYKFLTCEFPDYTCSTFNDVFAILMSPPPAGTPAFANDANGSTADVAFFTNQSGTNEVVGVNTPSFITACTTDSQAPTYTSCKGEAGLAGSGFEGHAASDWVTTHVPLPDFVADQDRVFSLRLAIWDSADSVLDSTAVVDGFEWSTDVLPTSRSTVEP